MTRARLLIIGLGLAMVAALAGPAAAQDGPAITVDPESVDAAGTQSFTVTGSGFTLPALFVLPCAYPADGDVANIGEDDCDLGALTPVSPDEEGAFSVEVEYDVPEEGMAIVAADAGQVETAAAVISVAGAEDEAAEEEPAEEEAAEEEPAEEAEGEDVEEAQEELPETGAESTTLAIIGLTVAAAGALVVGGSRRLSRG